jgi:hypothetical protein
MSSHALYTVLSGEGQVGADLSHVWGPLWVEAV